MNIIFLLSRIEQSGVTMHTLDLAKGLIEKGHTIKLITGGKVEENNKRLDTTYHTFQTLGVEIIEFKTPNGGLISKLFNSIKSTLQIIKLIQISKADIVHVQSPNLTFLPWLVGKKFITTLHNTKIRKTFKFKRPTHFIAISKESYEVAISYLGIRKEKISIINHGVSPKFATSISNIEKEKLKQELHIDSAHLVIGYVGRLSWAKGCDILVEAVAGLKAKNKSQISVVFLGGTEGSIDYIQLMKWIEEKQIADICKIVPFTDPKPFYDIFDVFVLPSRWESFPLVTLEAMLSNCCPIRSNVEGCSEQIVPFETGLVFENENSTELSNHLAYVIENPDDRKKMGENSKKMAQERFIIATMVKNTLTVYNKVRNQM